MKMRNLIDSFWAKIPWRPGLGLALLLAFSWPVTTQAAYTLIYSTNSDGTLTCSNYSGTGGATLTIPATVGSRAVTAIGTNAFAGATVKTLTLGSNITNIWDGAFSSCSTLTNFTIPSSVTNIGISAFANASKLTSLTLPNTVTSIGASAFSGCFGLTNFTLPNNLTTISASMFFNDTGLRSFIIPTNVTAIGDSAFNSCLLLTNISMPSSLTTLGNSAFAKCTSMTSVTIPTNVVTLGDLAFSGGSLMSVIIPNSVTNVGNWAFTNCVSLTNVTIGSGVTALATNAFQYCSGLTAAYFLGNQPTPSTTTFVPGTPAGMIVYYPPGTTGWGSTYGGRPTVLYAGSFSVKFRTNSPAGAGWKLDGGATANTNGAVVTNLTVTTHTISFSPVAGYTTPSNQIVSVNFNTTNSITNITYVPVVITANPTIYNRNYLTTWKFSVSDLLTNLSDPSASSSNVLSLASLSTSTNGVSLIIRTGNLLYYNPSMVNDQFNYIATNSLGISATGMVTVAIAPAQLLTGQQQSATINLSNHTATISFAGVTGYTYSIQVSTNLSNWTTLSTTNAPASGLFQFTDPNPPQPTAFYRLLWNGN